MAEDPSKVAEAESALAAVGRVLLPPLRFAAANGFARVDRLRGLAGLAERAVSDARLHETARARAVQIVSATAGFDDADIDQKRARVETLLALLHDGSSGSAAVEPTRVEVVPSAPARKRRAGQSAGRAATPKRVAPAALPAAPSADVWTLAVEDLPGVGPRRAGALRDRGFATAGDLLTLLPRTYEDRRRIRTIGELAPGGIAVVSGTVTVSGAGGFSRRGRRYDVAIDDGTGVMRLVYFHFRLAEMQSRFPRGERVTAAGEVAMLQGRLAMVHPRVVRGEQTQTLGGVHPVYPEVKGLHPAELGRAVRAALDVATARGLTDALPPAVRQTAGVCGIEEALVDVHAPKDGIDDDAFALLLARRSPGYRRLAFEELFVLATAMALKRAATAVDRAPALPALPASPDPYAGVFPFPLTAAQRRTIGEIGNDLATGVPMARLLQGDVGAGKTAVAAAAALQVVQAGHQVAFMAPTELLAEQHAEGLRRILTPLGIRVSLFTGTQRKKERALACARLRNRDVDVAVGTHALLSPDVEFARLGLCVVDEQHRFGVVQRSALKEKGPRDAHGISLVPHLLVMTATPIPRSLALTLYGDLAVSVLDELPPGRTPVATSIAGDPAVAHDAIAATLLRDENAFVVFPLIDESEHLDLAAATGGFEDLVHRFGAAQTALLHGRIDATERARIMERFVKGEVRVLVATTVIEVGVDVPRATLMVVMNAERFGLAQLHQLRGRVGRSNRPSRCLLVVPTSVSKEARQRLDALARTNDGFALAEEDLAMRGPGDLLGTRQAGVPSLAFADLVRHAPLIEVARAEAARIVRVDPALRDASHRALREIVAGRYAARLALATAG